MDMTIDNKEDVRKKQKAKNKFFKIEVGKQYVARIAHGKSHFVAAEITGKFSVDITTFKSAVVYVGNTSVKGLHVSVIGVSVRG